MMESFFATLKKERIYLETYATREAARQSVFEYIELFYNTHRRHSALGYLSPEQYENATRMEDSRKIAKHVAHKNSACEQTTWRGTSNDPHTEDPVQRPRARPWEARGPLSHARCVCKTT